MDHKGFGAMWAFEKVMPDVAFVIAGHHSGIPDRVTLQSRCESQTEDSWAGMAQYQTLRERLRSQSCPDLDPVAKPDYAALTKTPTDFDLRIRMLFSCLVDADYLDTEAYCRGDDARNPVTFPCTISELTDRFFADQDRFMRERAATFEGDRRLLDLRCRVFDEASTAGALPRGVYSMTVPTGGAKTRAALGFALEHVRTHGMSRVIVALPYTSILDQLAEEYTSIFGKDSFLLHYTGWQSRGHADDLEESDLEKKTRLAAENWDAPLILTTTVQLFDSVFSNQPSDCRKLHNIADSVIVLDEVQTLPLKYLEPICDVLGCLVMNCGVTVLLSTATQPALDRVSSFAKRVGKPKEIISNPEANYQILRRVEYEVCIDKLWSWEQVAETLLESGGSGMVVVNTKKHALDLFDLVRDREPRALHLSTFMCGAHRRDVIDEIRRRLKDKERCLLVATQLVEAGVDIDFPLVMRAVGPLDRIVQAAGRCNREGKLHRGKVIVFKPEDNKMPRGSYETGANTFEVMYRGKRFVPDDPNCFPDYFSRLFQDVDLGKEVNEERGRLNFPGVAERFHLVEDGGTRAVFVGYDGRENRWDKSPAQVLLAQLAEATREKRRLLYQRLQSYVVQIFCTQVNKMKANGQVLEDRATEELYWPLGYDRNVGIAQRKADTDSCIV